jgi:signal transduction histidine kinase
MSRSSHAEVVIKASVGRHLAFAPVAFAVTEGPAHTIVYANALFRTLLTAGHIGIGKSEHGNDPAPADLEPVLTKVRTMGKTARDVSIGPADGHPVNWCCTVWPVADLKGAAPRLIVEIRDVRLVEAAKHRQRAVTERLLLSALREQDLAVTAAEARSRADFLAGVSHDLSMSLDEQATRDTVRRLSLPRHGTWCIVDVVESNGALHRLTVVHPDPDKQALATRLEETWPPDRSAQGDGPYTLPGQVTTLTANSTDAVLQAAHGESNLRILREIGFGSLLIVPFVVRAQRTGAITFLSPGGDIAFTPDETALATELAARCAVALDNARLYREANAMRSAADEANRAKTEFLAAMSHELRTPLNAIGGFAELIDMGIRGPVTEQQHVALARIKANQKHLLVLITEILNFVRVESGRVEYKCRAERLRHVFDDVMEMLIGAATEKGLQLRIPEPDTPVVAWADPDRVRQILVNLVMNAVKYTPRDGGSIELRSALIGGTVVVEVEDTGPGIPEEKLGSIFEPFVQLAEGLAGRQGGVGLGLAISRDLAQGMRGDLSARSTVGVGSTFTLSLPSATRNEAPTGKETRH